MMRDRRNSDSQSITEIIDKTLVFPIILSLFCMPEIYIDLEAMLV